MSKPFKLSQSLVGHSLDVRSLVVTVENAIVSGSRDKTAKYWAPNSYSAAYQAQMTYRDQKNFVIAVLFIEPSAENPSGLVVTGGNDNVILIYKPHEPFASFTFKEHTNAVCSLQNGVKPNSFLSGSWDMSAKYWDLGKPESSQVTFSGHAAAVWSVLQLQNLQVVTASADKTIGIWTSDGQRLKTLQGHKDCVRGLIDFPQTNHFVSVSNDATIKIWSHSGQNVETCYGHTNYIYSIAKCPAGVDFTFVTSDEDRTVRYWENGVNVQTFHLPAQSVWTLACLSNGDIVTGASDGVVRIFTQDETRYADEEALKKFEEEVNSVQQQSQQEIGGYKVSDLPGREALYDPGKKPGQMKMIREAGGVVAYTWVDDGENSHWEKVGDVLGGTDKDTTGKTVYEGKAYDFVFSVDVEDGKPPLKLPYNKGDDPYVSAQAFLAKNFLPYDYLEQVVDFIHKNTKGLTENADSSSYVDPFVGSSRYVPGSGPRNAFDPVGANCDPFTGGSSYSTTGVQSANVPATNQSAKYFPQTEYRLFEAGDPNVILGKLKEFNGKSAAEKVSESDLESVIKMCSGNVTDVNCCDTVFKMLNSWPEDLLFPVLDVVRLAVRFETNNSEICKRDGGHVIEKLKTFIYGNSKIVNNTLVSLRILSNLFAGKMGEEFVFENRFDLLENITSLGTNNKSVQIALATFLLNVTVLVLKRGDDMGCSILANVLPDILTNFSDHEAEFRGFVALGTLVSSGNSQLKARVVENKRFMEKLNQVFVNHDNDVETKTRNCAAQVQAVLIK